MCVCVCALTHCSSMDERQWDSQTVPFGPLHVVDSSFLLLHVRDSQSRSEPLRSLAVTIRVVDVAAVAAAVVEGCDSNTAEIEKRLAPFGVEDLEVHTTILLPPAHALAAESGSFVATEQAGGTSPLPSPHDAVHSVLVLRHHRRHRRRTTAGVSGAVFVAVVAEEHRRSEDSSPPPAAASETPPRPYAASWFSFHSFCSNESRSQPTPSSPRTSSTAKSWRPQNESGSSGAAHRGPQSPSSIRRPSNEKMTRTAVVVVVSTSRLHGAWQ